MTRRPEQDDLLRGAATYVGDVQLPGALTAVIVRSPDAHARLHSVDVTPALAAPGVRAVLTARDLDRDVRLPIRQYSTPGMDLRTQSVLARDRVRYVGEPLAVVVADDAYLAEDAAELVDLELESLPAVVEPGHADTVPLFDGLDNVMCEWESRHGDVEEVFASADLVVATEFHNGRHMAMPIETRGIVAAWTDDGTCLDIWGPTKFLDFTRRVLAQWFGVDEEQIRCQRVQVGGMFGVRGELYPEDFLIPWAAQLVGAPVRWVEDRREHFLAINHSPEHAHRFELAVGNGELLAFRSRATLDLGAYARPVGGRLPMLNHLMLPGPYDWRAYEIATSGVMTNKTPTGTVRGPNAAECTFVRERSIDMAAARLGADPLALRRRSLIRPAQIPYVRRHGNLGVPDETYDSGDFPAVYDDFLHKVDYASWAEVAARRRAQGELVGVGAAAFLVHSAVGRIARVAVGFEAGRITIHTTANDIGQGIQTMLRTIAADTLGVDQADIAVQWGSTVGAPPSGGTAGSRSTVLLGNAVGDACRTLLARLEKHDGHEPILVEGSFSGTPTNAIGLHAALVRVDADTLEPTVERLAVCYDAGHAVDPEGVRGQLVGATVQALGAALYEELRYDEFGELLTASLMDYLMPTHAEAPDVQAIIYETADPGNPLGARGAGEAGVFGVAAVIGTAVAQALGRSEVGVTSFPIAPATLRSERSEHLTTGRSGH